MNTIVSVVEEVPAQRGGAKALLLTILGEFVLPAGGAAWTSSLVASAEVLGIGEKNARQAIARIGDQGVIASERHGRRVRWSLTGDGRTLLESGARRIYEFGTTSVDWSGEWLVAHCQVSEPRRALRHRLRTQLGFLGFGEVSASLLVSPHVERETELRSVLAGLGLLDETIIFRSTTGSQAEDAEIVNRAWDVDGLAAAYGSFCRRQREREPKDAASSFRAVVELVHDWRRFPFLDPELPTELLPHEWAGRSAAAMFADRHADWSPAAKEWFARLEASEPEAT